MTCERNLCDGSGVVQVGEDETTCNCAEGVALSRYVEEHGGRLLVIPVEEVDERPATERLRGLGAPAWQVFDLSDAETGPFERTDLEEIPPFDPPAERLEALRAARVEAELADEPGVEVAA